MSGRHTSSPTLLSHTVSFSLCGAGHTDLQHHSDVACPVRTRDASRGLPGDQPSQIGYFVALPVPVEWELHVDETFQGKSIKSVSFSSSSCFHQRRSCLGLIWGKEQSKEGRKQKKTWAEWPRLQKHPPADGGHQAAVCQLRKHVWSWAFFICGQSLKITEKVLLSGSFYRLRYQASVDPGSEVWELGIAHPSTAGRADEKQVRPWIPITFFPSGFNWHIIPQGSLSSSVKAEVANAFHRRGDVVRLIVASTRIPWRMPVTGWASSPCQTALVSAVCKWWLFQVLERSASKVFLKDDKWDCSKLACVCACFSDPT